MIMMLAKIMSPYQDMDHKFFWYLVNKGRRGDKQKINPIKDVNGKILTDPDDIRDSWRAYFSGLYTPKDHDHYDKDFKQFVDSHVENLKSISLTRTPKGEFKHYSMEEIQATINKLKCNRAPGSDQIQPVHVKYAGTSVIIVLKCIINSICQIEYTPPQFKIGVLIPNP